MKPIFTFLFLFLLLLQTLSLYGLEVDMVRYELIHKNQAKNIDENFLLRIDENKNLYAIVDISGYADVRLIKKYNANGQLLWSKKIEEEPLEPPTDKSIVPEYTRFIDVQYFKNHIYAFSVYLFKGKDENSNDEHLYVYEIAKYNADGKLINRQPIFKSTDTIKPQDNDYWAISHIYDNKIYFAIGNIEHSTFVGMYDLTIDKIKPIETIQLNSFARTQMEVGEYGVYIAHNNLIKKYNLQGNSLSTEQVKGENVFIHKIIADQDGVFIIFDKKEGSLIRAYDHNKNLLWNKPSSTSGTDFITSEEALYSVYTKYDKKNGKTLFETESGYHDFEIMIPHKNGIFFWGWYGHQNYNHQKPIDF